MKFRYPQTGKVFEDINTCVDRKCQERANCGDWCTLYKKKPYCKSWAENHPAEAARLMGMEVVGGNAVEGMCCDCAEGGLCCDFSENEDCPSRKEDGGCWRPYTEKEEPMDKMDKPRICEVLGVEVGEVFTADTPYGRFQRCVIDEEGQILNTGTNVLCYMLNHPDRIIRKLRFTQEEVAVLNYACKCYDIDCTGILERLQDGTLKLHGDSVEVFFPGGFFPSIRPEQAVKLEDILGGAP